MAPLPSTVEDHAAWLAPDLVRDALDAASRHCPHEWCAVGLGGAGQVELLVHLPNTASNPESEFRIDPVQLASTLASGRRRGLELTMILHSHPSGLGELSEADLSVIGAWPGVVHAVVTPERAPSVRCFRIIAGECVEVPLRAGRRRGGPAPRAYGRRQSEVTGHA